MMNTNIFQLTLIFAASIQIVVNAIPTSLEQRRPGMFYCSPAGHEWRGAHISNIQKFINELRTDKSIAFSVPAVAGQGGLIKCDEATGSSIWIYNDNPQAITVEKTTIADYAQIIKDNCQMPGDSLGKMALGQKFDTEGYNVVVRQEPGCKGNF